MPFDNPQPIPTETLTPANKLLDGVIELLSDPCRWTKGVERRQPFVGLPSYCVLGALVHVASNHSRESFDTVLLRLDAVARCYHYPDITAFNDNWATMMNFLRDTASQYKGV